MLSRCRVTLFAGSVKYKPLLEEILDRDALKASVEGAGPKLDRLETSRLLAKDVFSRGAQLWKSVDAIRFLSDGNLSYPEIAFIGEAGSGKSSLVKALSKIPAVRVGLSPGVTNTLNFYNVGNILLLADTPGFGFWGRRTRAHSKRDVRIRFEASRGQMLTMQYLALRKHANLRRVYWCIPANKPELTPADQFVANFLMKERIPFTVVVTKMDEALDPSSIAAVKRRFKDRHPSHIPGDRDLPPFPNSAAAREEAVIRDTYRDVQTRLRTLLDPLLVPNLSGMRGSTTDDDDRDLVVPVLDTSAQKDHNMDILAVDVVYQIGLELPETQLDLRHLERISYAPASVPFQLAVERTYTLSVAEQIYEANANYLALAARGESAPRSVAAALGFTDGGAITSRTVEDALLESSNAPGGPTLSAPSAATAHQLPSASALDDNDDRSFTSRATTDLLGSSAAAAGSVRQSHDAEDVYRVEGVMLHHRGPSSGSSSVATKEDRATGDTSASTTAVADRDDGCASVSMIEDTESAMLARLHESLVGVVAAAQEESAPVDASPKAFNRYMAEHLGERAEDRALATYEPSFATVSNASQLFEMKQEGGEARFEAAVDNIWGSVLRDDAPFNDKSANVKRKGTPWHKKRLDKYINASGRHERPWRIDSAAYLNPFTKAHSEHNVAGAEGKTLERSTGAGYRMDGLRDRAVFGVTRKTKKKSRELYHKWARPVTNGVN